MKPENYKLQLYKATKLWPVKLIFWFLFVPGIVHAQGREQTGMPAGVPKNGGTLSGTVIDSLTKKPLDYSTVSLFKTGVAAPLNGSLTDEKGNFKITNVAPGSYRIQIAFIGYATKTINSIVLTEAKPDKNLGQVIVAPSAKMLAAVEVTGQKALIENHIDKLVFNAEKDVTSTGGNASDMLRKVPMVSVDMDGNVALRGSQNVRILINGKPSGALVTNAADVLKSMPSDQIKNIEVITSPSAKYDAEGSAGIINIVTKKKEVSGVSGSVSAGIGTRQNNESGNISFNKNKLSLTANFGYNTGWPQTTYTAFSSQNTELGTSSSSSGQNTSNRHFTNGSASLGYDFDNNNTLSSSFSMRGGAFKNNGSSTNSNTSAEEGTVDYTALTSNEFKISNFDWNTDFTHKFKKEGEELSFAVQWTHGTSDINYLSEYTAFTQNQQATNNGINNEYTFQADYVLPISKVFKLETGAKSILRRITSEYDFFNPDASGAYVFNPATSNSYNYDQDVYSGYGLVTATLKNGFTIQAGARLESTKINGNSGNTSVGLSPFNNTYTNFIPSFVISKALTPTQTLKLSYSKRIQRPSLQFLNPFRNTSNPLNQTQGNPELSPEVTQTVELNYSTFIKSSTINASVYYRKTDDIIESYVSTVPFTTVDNEGNMVTRDVSLTNYLNVGNNNSIGATLFGSTELFKILTIRGNINAFTYKPQIISTLQQGSQSTYIQYNAFVSGTVKLNKTLSAETFLIQNSARRTFQGTNPSFNLWVIGLKQDVWQKRGTIGLNITQPFKDYKDFTSNINSGPLTQSNRFSVPFRSFGVSFAYNFGKMNFGQQMPKKKRGVDNDDLKQGDSNGQGGQSGH
ncbi:TonB-dependent receptor domain-containing protein [Mucilaginibacter aquaedulcis]|uniref:TonB-dependent receptor domain-containing protein n=1 Tax=Mucilaginibacter aquaedulcis TaxID=1187081 RepID=UPI0025B38DBA|nr:TonB-dependent receptor [Mucilaginibacter aquaedulcis]MDN3551644.1 TonB-dependent receptor [Mucilaginibacter aquaedulcis]